MSNFIKLRPMDTLPNGTKITIINKGKGEVVSSRQTRDQHGKPIMVHTVKRTHNMEGRAVEEKPFGCNYSFILYRAEDIHF